MTDFCIRGGRGGSGYLADDLTNFFILSGGYSADGVWSSGTNATAATTSSGSDFGVAGAGLSVQHEPTAESNNGPGVSV